MNVVDSSAWLEYFSNGHNAQVFANPIEDTENLIVPSITILEVFKRILQQRNENVALQAIAQMRQGKIEDLDMNLSLSAAKLGVTHKLPLADSIILATAYRFQAILWTQDDDFKGLADVRYFPKPPKTI